ncbi:MAG: hypothetical protein R2807_01415 [Chitinophagales bacterium]
METSKKATRYFYASLICAIWFALTSFFWSYYANVLMSFPIGLISFYTWKKGKQMEPDALRFKLVWSILFAGVVISLLSLLFFYK